jgi:sterol desaturase/sphingolipid hydroxylase (fatty acid hydroxylase superfamily)
LIVPIIVLLWFGVASRDDFRLGHYHGFGPVALQPVWLQLIEIYLMFDFIGYWMHRLFHRRRWWPFHAVHHSSEDLDWLSSVRIHPVNDLISKFCQLTPFLLLGFNPFITLSTAPFFTFHAIFVHAAVDWDFGPLRGIIVSPVFHRWHHSKDRAAWDKNFSGLFAFWDRIFGTYYMPADRLPENFGIPEEFPGDFLRQLGQPFVKFVAKRPALRSTPPPARVAPASPRDPPEAAS